MFFNIFFLEAWVFILSFYRCADSQLNDHNLSVLPYPYQTVLGIPPSQELGPQNFGVQPPVGSFPYPYLGTIPSPIPNATTTQYYNNYYSMLAQQGRPAYQYPLGYPQPGIGYAQPSFGYPQLGIGYQPAGGFGYPYQGLPQNNPYPGFTQGMGAQYYVSGAFQPIAGTVQPQNQYGRNAEPYSNVKTEFIDVSPEFHRQVLGLPSERTFDASNRGNSVGGGSQESPKIEPRFNVKVDSQTSNFTYVPSNLTKPIIATKQFTTSIRRSFVYDSSKPGQNQTVNLHFVNGEPVTTVAPPTTTENEEVEGPSVTPKGRRFMDVPASCPKGTLVDNKGNCVAPFFAARLELPKNTTPETILTQAPDQDLNAI